MHVHCDGVDLQVTQSPVACPRSVFIHMKMGDQTSPHGALAVTSEIVIDKRRFDDHQISKRGETKMRF